MIHESQLWSPTEHQALSNGDGEMGASEYAPWQAQAHRTESQSELPVAVL